MSQRDRSSQERGFDDDARRDRRARDFYPDQQIGRREDTELDDDAFELPAWGTHRQRPAGRPNAERQPGGQSPARSQRGSQSPGGGGTRREPLPTLGDAFRRPGRRPEPEPDDRSFTSTRDPYDRLRRVASRPQRPVEFEDLGELDDQYIDYEADALDERLAVPQQRPPRRRAAASAFERRAGTPRPHAAQQIGGLIAAAGPQTRLVAGMLGFAALSLVLMGATVAGRMSSLPAWVPIHLNAEGDPDRWGTSSTLWRMPLMAIMLTLMSAAVAWYSWKRDPFAAHFTLATLVLIHALIWVGLINLAW